MAEVVKMPKLGFDMAEGIVIRWIAQEGDQIFKGDVLVEIETDKATVEVEAPQTGFVLKHLAEAGDIVPINDPIAILGEEGEEADLSEFSDSEEDKATPKVEEKEVLPAASSPTTPVPVEEGTNLPDGVRASPLARKMAKELDLDIRKVSGTGQNGRIVKSDVESYLDSPQLETAPVLGTAPISTAKAAAEDVIVPLTKLRQAIGRRMTESKQWFPHFYVTYDYDVSELMRFRSEANALLSESGVKLSVNDFIVKAVALTLKEFPNLNASLGNNEIIQHGQVNIGVAVAVEAGLLTVVCKDAQSKTISQISQEVRSMALKARDGKVRPEDIEGSTFTTSNLGMYGVDEFTAIINPPEAAILAIGGAREIPVAKDGEVSTGWRMKMTISADHRVTDGAEAAQFMQALAGYLENPIKMVV